MTKLGAKGSSCDEPVSKRLGLWRNRAACRRCNAEKKTTKVGPKARTVTRLGSLPSPRLEIASSTRRRRARAWKPWPERP